MLDVFVCMLRYGMSLVLAFVMLPSLGWSQGLDPATAEALSKAQQLLQDRAQRQQAIGKSADAQKIDGQVQQMLGPQGTEDFYKAAGAVMGDVTRQNGGDAAKMQEALQKAQANPQAFYNSLSPENRKAIEEVARKHGGASAGQAAPASIAPGGCIDPPRGAGLQQPPSNQR